MTTMDALFISLFIGSSAGMAFVCIVALAVVVWEDSMDETPEEVDQAIESTVVFCESCKWVGPLDEANRFSGRHYNGCWAHLDAECPQCGGMARAYGIPYLGHLEES